MRNIQSNPFFFLFYCYVRVYLSIVPIYFTTDSIETCSQLLLLRNYMLWNFGIFTIQAFVHPFFMLTNYKATHCRTVLVFCAKSVGTLKEYWLSRESNQRQNYCVYLFRTFLFFFNIWVINHRNAFQSI